MESVPPATSRSIQMMDIHGVARKLAMCTRTIRAMVSSGEFPPPITLRDLPNSKLVWREDEVDQWLAERLADRE